MKKIGIGFFGGEGFIMQKFEGDGFVFMYVGGIVYKCELKFGEKFCIDIGCFVVMIKDINYDVEFVGKVKIVLFGGEGLFFVILEGFGIVWIQFLIFSCLVVCFISLVV